MKQSLECTASGPQVGDLAPDFSLRSQVGVEVQLHEILERDIAVLYFYLRDATPV